MTYEAISEWNRKGEVTENKQVQAPVVVVFIYKQTLSAIYTTPQQLYKILMANLIYQIDFIEKLINPLSCIQKQSLYSNFFSIRKNSL